MDLHYLGSAETFTQVSANVWVTTPDPRDAAMAAIGTRDMAKGGCHPMYTSTLWRKSAEEPFWNLSDTTTLPPNDAPECAKLFHRMDWISSYDPVQLNCKTIA
jgi:hypothetical protein